MGLTTSPVFISFLFFLLNLTLRNLETYTFKKLASMYLINKKKTTTTIQEVNALRLRKEIKKN